MWHHSLVWTKSACGVSLQYRVRSSFLSALLLLWLDLSLVWLLWWFFLLDMLWESVIVFIGDSSCRWRGESVICAGYLCWWLHLWMLRGASHLWWSVLLVTLPLDSSSQSPLSMVTPLIGSSESVGDSSSLEGGRGIEMQLKHLVPVAFHGVWSRLPHYRLWATLAGVCMCGLHWAGAMGRVIGVLVAWGWVAWLQGTQLGRHCVWGLSAPILAGVVQGVGCIVWVPGVNSTLMGRQLLGEGPFMAE